MSNIQIIVADRAGVRIYEARSGDPELHVLDEIANTALGRHERDLVASRAGRRRNPATRQPQEIAPRSRARDNAVGAFARAIARRSSTRARLRGHDALILVAEPRMLGEIRSRLSKASLARLASQVAKDLTHVDAAVLARRLRPALLEAQWLCETGTPR